MRFVGIREQKKRRQFLDSSLPVSIFADELLIPN